MYSKVTSGGVLGVEGLLIQVETDINDGLPMFHMVGFLSACVKEAGERVRTALKTLDFRYHRKRSRSIYHRQISGRKELPTIFPLP